jgi:hypothetical protein
MTNNSLETDERAEPRKKGGRSGITVRRFLASGGCILAFAMGIGVIFVAYAPMSPDRIPRVVIDGSGTRAAPRGSRLLWSLPTATVPLLRKARVTKLGGAHLFPSANPDQLKPCQILVRVCHVDHRGVRGPGHRLRSASFIQHSSSALGAPALFPAIVQPEGGGLPNETVSDRAYGADAWGLRGPVDLRLWCFRWCQHTIDRSQHSRTHLSI